MDGRAFLDVADELVTMDHEGHWRSAVSRGYSAAFHAARALVEACGFAVPRAERAHQYLILRLQNAGHPDVEGAGNRLHDLRQARNRSDYDLARPHAHVTCVELVQRAADVVRLCEEAMASGPVRARITDTIRAYERDVLADITWRPLA